MRYNMRELRTEALSYLGFKTNCEDREILRILNKQEKKLEMFTPKYIYKLYEAEHRLLVGKDIREHLKGCRSAVFLVATLGANVDKTIRRLEITSLSEALVFDALANAAIEQVLDFAELEIKQKLKSDLTSRYSPGYGDFPLEIQENFLNAVDAVRKLGITVNNSLLLTPCKSVTAVLGVRSKALFSV